MDGKGFSIFTKGKGRKMKGLLSCKSNGYWKAGAGSLLALLCFHTGRERDIAMMIPIAAAAHVHVHDLHHLFRDLEAMASKTKPNQTIQEIY